VVVESLFTSVVVTLGKSVVIKFVEVSSGLEVVTVVTDGTVRMKSQLDKIKTKNKDAKSSSLFIVILQIKN
jgi:hypothetical protein